MHLRFRNAGRLLLVIGCLVGCNHQIAPVEPPPAEEAAYELSADGLLKVRADLIPELRFARAERSRVVAQIHGVGEVDFSPGSLTALRVPFDGIVESVEVTAGQTVETGQLLATIRSSELAKMRADIRRIDSALVGQYDALNRAKDLVQQEAISNRRIIELQSGIGSLEAERNGILVALRAANTTQEGEDLFELRSPREGQAIKRNVDPGEQVRDPANEPAFVIADPRKLMVRAQFPERDAPLLDEGLVCRIEIPSLGSGVLSGRVQSVVRSIDPENRTIDVTASFDESSPRVRAHMLARINVMVEGEPELMVPREAVLLRRDSKIVLVRKSDDLIERRAVIVGASIDSNLVILSGLSEGEEVVIEGAVLLDGELDRLL